MTDELTAHSNVNENEPANEEESNFLSLISELTLSDLQISELEKPIEVGEIEEILLSAILTAPRGLTASPTEF